MDVDILRIAEEIPGVNITVKASDLMAMASRIIEQSRREAIAERAKDRAAELMSREAVMAKLGVAPSTLWRWKNKGYLMPLLIGGQYRYRVTDVNEILEGKR